MSDSTVELRNIAYADSERGLKEHEKEMLENIREFNLAEEMDILDIGCADGVFLELMSQQIKCGRIDGIDNDEKLIEIACNRQYNCKESNFSYDDIQALIDKNHSFSEQKYDAIIASGILVCFEDVDLLIKALTGLLKEGGRLYIFGKTITRPVDIHISLRPAGQEEWDQERYILSIEHLQKIINKHLEVLKTEEFKIPFDLKEKENIYSTYSINTTEGDRLVMTRFNLLVEHRFIIAGK